MNSIDIVADLNWLSAQVGILYVVELKLIGFKKLPNRTRMSILNCVFQSKTFIGDFEHIAHMSIL